jgi:hypothetical protein
MQSSTHHAAGNGQAPPANGEAERGLLRSLFSLPEALDLPAVAAVQPSDLADAQYATIYRHLRDGWRAGHGPESVSARLAAAGEWSDDVRLALVELCRECVTGSDAAYFAELVREEAERRSLWQLRHQLDRQLGDKLPPADVRGFLESYLANSASSFRQTTNGGPQDMADVIEHNKELRPVVINGLARVGEVVNIVAPSKRGKSWLVLMLVLCVVVGKRLFDAFTCTPGKVLLIDNELHSQTSAFRVRAVAKAMGVEINELRGQFQIDNVRGQNLDINALVGYLARFKPGELTVIVLDALYRFYPKGFDENSNADMTWLYNVLDGIANRLQCVIVCIVHSSKGNQADKSLVDVGSGAGAIARAADTHFAIREHEQPGCVVADYTARSFAPSDPICLRWAWPLWVRDDTLDPDKLYRPGKRGKDKATETIWTAELFAERFCGPEAKPVALIVAEACESGMSSRKANELVKQADALGKLHRWLQEDRRALVYATVPQPEDQKPKPANAAKQPKTKGRKAGK